MNFARYRPLLADSAVRRLLLLGFVLRIPHSAAPLLLTLHVVDQLGLGYAQAGVVAMSMTVGMALGGPWRGRRVDTDGLRRALAPSVIIESAVWLSVPWLGYEVLVGAAFVAGIFILPLFTVLRSALAILVPISGRRTAFALDSMFIEASFMIGPAAAVLIATRASSQVYMPLIGLLIAAGGLTLMAFNPPVQAAERQSRGSAAGQSLPVANSADTAAVGAKVSRWLTPAILGIFGVTFSAGFVLVGTDIGILAALRATEEEAKLGLVFFFWCLSSLIGGLLYGAAPRSVRPFYLLLGLAVLTLPLVIATGVPALAVLAFIAGLFCAPTLAAASETIVELVPATRRGEAMGWFGSALTVGSAVASPIVGAAIDLGGARAGFATAAGVAVVLAIAGLALAPDRRIFAHRVPDVDSPAAPEPAPVLVPAAAGN